MSELRIYKKEDGTEVLQEKKCLTVPGSSLRTKFEWKDVPVVFERKMPLRTGKIPSVSGCTGGECGMNGSEFELTVTHRLSESHRNDHDLIVNDALPDYRMIIRHAKILLSDNGFSKVKYLVQSYDADPHSYIPKEIFSNYPCLNLYDQEYINSKRKPKNEVFSFGFGSTQNVGFLEIRHFRNEYGEQQFDRWKPGQVIANRKNHRRSKMIIRDSVISSVSNMFNIIRYRIEVIDNDELPVEYVRQGEEFEVVENIIGKSEISIPVPSVCEQPSCDTMLVEDGVNEVMEFGQFILNKIEGLHCRNVKGWHKDFIEFKIKEKFKKS